MRGLRRLLPPRTLLRLRAAARPRAVVLTDVHGDLTAGDLDGQLQLVDRRGATPHRLADLPADAPLRQVLLSALSGAGHLDLRSAGTTDVPRVLRRGPLTPAQLGALADLSHRIGLRRGRAVAIAGPGVHVHGLLIALGALGLGAPLVDLSHLPVQDRIALLHRTTPRVLAGVPVHLADLLEADRDLSRHRSLRIARVVSGSERLDPELAADLARHWRARVHDVYGTSETGTLSVDGRPLRGVRVRSRDGILRVRTPFTGRRWLVTDRGEVDGKGRVSVVGRADGSDASGAMLHDPRAVVRLLQAQPGIAGVRLKVVPDARHGRRTVAHVVLEDTGGPLVTTAGIRALVRDRLGASSVPREVRIVDRGPREPDD